MDDEESSAKQETSKDVKEEMTEESRTSEHGNESGDAAADVKKDKLKEEEEMNDENEEEGLLDAPAGGIDVRRQSSAPQVDLNQLHSDPDFAAICSFFNKFGVLLGIKNVLISFTKLEEMLTTFDEKGRVNKELLDLHMSLMRRIRFLSVRADNWENYLKKFLGLNESTEEELFKLERYGYVHLPVSVKIQILKALCEAQFDFNPKLKEHLVSTCKAVDLRLIPVGNDKDGLSYWVQKDQKHDIRVYTEEPDDLSGTTWKLIAKTRDDLDGIINRLKETDLGYKKKSTNEDEKKKKEGQAAVSPEEGTMNLATKKGTFIDVCYDEQTVKKMREHLLNQKEERRNRIQGKVTKVNESKQSSDEEDEVESEKTEKNKEEELDVLGHRLLPRRSAASKALNMICSPQRKKVERKKKEKEENGDSNDVPEEKNKISSDEISTIPLTGLYFKRKLF
ncbi:hypothetical protein WR25_08744 [Diploscapter pachys]|uniref:DDT domain-containing protein n=1 Tax=Diploscapter pachys TaxID=2018661 RepID=A0A2A2KJP8_9BILA|nr:hypothetical protein WR25_08744 [Diploscapter pachys]